MNSSGNSRPAYPITSVDNALRLMLMFKEHRRVRLSDAAEELGVATSTAHRLLAMLQFHGFVRQEENVRTYVPGPAFLDIGLAAVRNMDIREHARPVLTDLAMRLGETVHLAQLEGANVRYLIGAEGGEALRVVDRTGQVVPAHTSATGRVLLADLPESRLGPIVERLVTQDAQLSGLYKELEQIRQRGYAVNARPDDVISVATPVRDGDDVTVAAINAVGPASRMTQRDQRRVVRHLHAAAAQLEDILRAAPSC
ncbi:IclR family transcriptional regulator [Streptomyces sp. NPDC052309]|uniref:IclR family transcriptional regulator n=1 Tax=Streptomyces griseicoloratus TaxID=2752516 RepID=A0A926QUZ9_9ACTN|nr:IclR family transcriptional regulator [Streptomyces griseicoloratus]MBD0423652.1 IclR family transcriptional regulator [Streptomyces griseicoloratus]